MKSVRLLILITLGAIVLPVRAAEIKGTVKSVSGDSASVTIEGDVMPPNGAKAEIFFRLDSDEISVASATALHIDQGELRVSIDNATGAVEPGHLVRFPGTTAGTSGNTAVAAPTTPAPVPDDPNDDPFIIVADDSPAHSYLSRAGAQHKAGDWNAAIATLTKGIKAAPSVGELYLLRGNLYMEKQKARPAIADATKALELKSVKPYVAYLIRGTSKADQGNFKGAIADLDKAIEEKSDYGAAYNNRASFKMSLRDFRGALADCNKAVELKPKSALPYHNRGYVYENLGDFASALNDFRHALELDSSLAKELNPKITRLERKVGKAGGKKNPPVDDDL